MISIQGKARPSLKLTLASVNRVLGLLGLTLVVGVGEGELTRFYLTRSRWFES
jgi:hypothetical protein